MFGILKKGFGAVAIMAVCASAMEVSAQARYAETVKFDDGTSRTLNYHTWSVDLDGVADLEVPKGFKYLTPKDAKFVMEDLFGNDPADTLGLLVPAETMITGKLTSKSYFVDVTWNPDGYVSDKDASTMNYGEVLKTLQEQQKAYNEESDSENKGEILGWAENPSYDQANKVLYFAKNVRFFSSTGSTLNYNMQFLGRRGYVQLNLVSDINSLQVVKKDFPTLLGSVKFKDGHKYSDFDPKVDTVSEYGLLWLLGVAGTAAVAKKAGLIVLLVKFWKILAIAVIGAYAKFKDRIKGWFGR